MMGLYLSPASTDDAFINNISVFASFSEATTEKFAEANQLYPQQQIKRDVFTINTVCLVIIATVALVLAPISVALGSFALASVSFSASKYYEGQAQYLDHIRSQGIADTTAIVLKTQQILLNMNKEAVKKFEGEKSVYLIANLCTIILNSKAPVELRKAGAHFLITNCYSTHKTWLQSHNLNNLLS